MILLGQLSQPRFMSLGLVFLLTLMFSGCNQENNASDSITPDQQAQDDLLTQDDTTATVENQQPNAKINAPNALTSGQTVTLNGTGSSDPDRDPLSYKWTQTKGPGITLSDSTSSKLTFVAPMVSQVTQFNFQLTVNDGELSNSASVSIQISPLADNTSPSIISRTPQTNQSGVPITAEISVGFNKALRENSITSQSMVLRQSGTLVAGEVSYDSFTKTIMLKPALALSPDTTYTVTLADTLEDHSGNAIAGESWSFSTTVEMVADGQCATAIEGNSLMLSCPAGQVIKGVTFASYGNPGGSCGSFTVGTCNASSSEALVSDACKGKSSCALYAGSDPFGDPCESTAKKLAAQVACGMATDTDTHPTPNPTPATVPTKPPSDAIILFNSEINTEWVSEDGGDVEWEVKDSILTIKPGAGSIYTKRAFADYQLHVEWRSPEEITGEGQGRGNSGIFMQSHYEVQILDSYQNPTYPDGQAGAIYKQHIPLVNASRKPGEWQTFDITYIAPRFNNDGTLKKPAYITVIHNDVIIHDYVEIKGRTVNSGNPKYNKHPFSMPISLQEHGNPVSFRNIWVREINTQKLFNGKDFSGWYTYLKTHGKNNDPDNIFTVEDGQIHILGKDPGYLCTEKEYENYYLRVVFRWGDKRFPPRENDKRDSGILYHFGKNSNDKIWPKSLECQIQESDCGDIWLVGGVDIETDNKREKNRIIKTADFESPKGEWNTIEVISNGNQIEHYVNGHLVNSGINSTVSKGKILLQSEWAEVIYKSVELIPF